MLGIKAIASYIPEGRASNVDCGARFDIDEQFIREKIGVVERAIKGHDQDTSDIAKLALDRLLSKQILDPARIEVLVVVTQNPDRNIPHVSAQVHGNTGLSESCAAFDISLGCSGYVYGLAILQSFMDAHSMHCGVLITADPYSKIVDDDDRNTALLFGDAATATLITNTPVWKVAPFTFGSRGRDWRAIRTDDGALVMDGRGVFNFAATTIPDDVRKVVSAAGLAPDQIDMYILHQGSRFIVKTIAERLKQPTDKVPIEIDHCGNTVSSTIPLIAERALEDRSLRRIIMSGFGVGLSWASCLCERVDCND